MTTTFNHKDAYILEDDYVLLRPLQADDEHLLIPFALNEPDTWRYSSVPVTGKMGMIEYIRNALAAREAGREYAFIVFDKKQNAYAGSTRFYDIQPANQMLQLGYTWYGEKFRGTGLNKRCKYLLLQFAFETLEMERVEFRADARNDRSVAAMKSLGCQVEGTIRSHMPIADGTRRNSVILSILKSEWVGGVRELLKGKLA